MANGEQQYIGLSNEELQRELASKSKELDKLKNDFTEFKTKIVPVIEKNSKENDLQSTSIPEMKRNLTDSTSSILKDIDKCTDTKEAINKAAEFVQVFEEKWNTIAYSFDNIRQLSYRIEKQEQYSRLNNLLLHGLLNVPTHLKGYQFCVWVVEQINKLLGHMLDFRIIPADIDCAHPLPSRSNKSLVIVKFVSRAVRNEVFYKKKGLKNMRGPKVTITEHLISSNLELLNKTKDIVGERNVWSSQCKIFGKVGIGKEGVVFRINGTEDLNNLQIEHSKFLSLMENKSSDSDQSSTPTSTYLPPNRNYVHSQSHRRPQTGFNHPSGGGGNGT